MISRQILHMNLAILLMLTLSMGSIVHSLVPHSHSHADEPANGIWDNIHSALRGEDKKILGTLPAVFYILCYIFFSVLILGAGRFILYSRASVEKNPDGIKLALKRGTLAYRAFG